MRRAQISGTGMYVPSCLITNAQMIEILGKPLSDSIEGKLGIFQRYVTGDEESAADLATHAGRAALADAKLAATELDLIIVATDTPEYISPATSAVVQGRLGAVRAGAFDLNASCAGFVSAMETAARMIISGSDYRHILVCGVYNMTKFIDKKDEKTVPIFADGGGAVVLSAGEGDAGFISSSIYADGTQYDLLGIYAGGTKYPISHERIDRKEHLLTFLKPLPPGRNIELWPRLIPEALAKGGLKVDEVDHFFLTQINRWVIKEVMQILGQPMSKAACIMDRYGYTGSACIPMALDDARKAGRVKEGSVIVMAGSGVGLSVACAVFRL